MLGRGHSGEVAKSGIHIEQLNERLTLLPDRLVLAGSLNNEGHPGRNFIVRRLPPHTHVTEMPTVVTPEHDDSILALTRLIEFVENQANLRIDI